MDIEVLKSQIDEQHGRNLQRWGKQPMATLILETEDQMAKLRDAFLHRTSSQVLRRVINVGSLLWAIAEQLDPLLEHLPAQSIHHKG